MRIKKIVAAAGAVATVLVLAVAAPAAAAVAQPAAAPPDTARPAAAPPDPGAVPGCEAGCEVVFVKQLPDDVRLAGLRTTDPATGFVRSLVTYWIGDQLHDVAEPVETAYVLDAACGYDGDAQRCAATFAVGAHSTVVASMLLTGDRGIEVTDRVTAGTPDAVLTDVDGSGRPDAVVRQSSYDPDYASAPRWWETWLEFDGRFVRSGCSEPVTGPQDPPQVPLYGPCPVF